MLPVGAGAVGRFATLDRDDVPMLARILVAAVFNEYAPLGRYAKAEVLVLRSSLIDRYAFRVRLRCCHCWYIPAPGSGLQPRTIRYE